MELEIVILPSPLFSGYTLGCRKHDGTEGRPDEIMGTTWGPAPILQVHGFYLQHT